MPEWLKKNAFDVCLAVAVMFLLAFVAHGIVTGIMAMPGAGS